MVGAKSKRAEDPGVKLDRAVSAASILADFDRATVDRVVRAVAEAGRKHGDRFAKQAVEECGFGVVRDKAAKNEAMSAGFLREYGDWDLVNHQVNEKRQLLEVPRPAGVVFAVTPSTSPVAAVYFKVLSALLTRNAVVVSPHPAVAETCIEAVDILRAAAMGAGAPEGAIEVFTEPSVQLIESTMADPRVNLILATGGGAVVRAAYRSGTPAIGVGPGNPPLVVDETADLQQAAKDIITSKAFDNSVLCTAESVLFVVKSVASALLEELIRAGAHVCSTSETRQLRSYVYPGGKFNTDVVGRPAVEIARSAGFNVGADTAVLLAPINSITDEESFTHEKLSPILAIREVTNFDEALSSACTLVDIVGRGHSAVIHSREPQRVLDFSVTLPVHRITVNAPGSLGNAGLGTNLPATMSVGTGFSGGSSSGDNLTPAHLVQWTRTSYASDRGVKFPDFARMSPGIAASSGLERLVGVSRVDLRQIIAEELRGLIGGSGG